MRFSNGVSVYELTNLPGCPQVCVSHGMFIKPEHRGQGLSTDEMRRRLARCKDLGYNVVTCTVSMNNSAQLHVLYKIGWVKDYEFVSNKTGNTVGSYHYIL